MKRIQTLLMRMFIASVALAALPVVLCETGLLPQGVLAGRQGSDEFIVLCFMELLTICVIPIALRLFRFKSVAKKLKTQRGAFACAMIRLLALCVPMVANAVLYYLYMNVAFGYMGIILLLCLAFVMPTMERCESEFGRLQDDVPQKDVE